MPEAPSGVLVSEAADSEPLTLARDRKRILVRSHYVLQRDCDEHLRDRPACAIPRWRRRRDGGAL